MIRRTRQSQAGVDRWMISWADLLTLLFASMVVLYASSLRERLKPPPPVAAPAAAPAVQAQAPAIASPPVNELAAPLATLKASLASELAKDDLQVAMMPQGIVISLTDGVYFTSGSDQIEPGAIESIGRIAAVIRDLPNTVRLEGHSDSVPIHNRRFRDNWSLSAARGVAVLTLLESRFGIPANRLAIAGYAENQPISENESAQGRARNRRVDIVILSESK